MGGWGADGTAVARKCLPSKDSFRFLLVIVLSCRWAPSCSPAARCRRSTPLPTSWPCPLKCAWRTHTSSTRSRWVARYSECSAVQCSSRTAVWPVVALPDAALKRALTPSTRSRWHCTALSDFPAVLLARWRSAQTAHAALPVTSPCPSLPAAACRCGWALCRRGPAASCSTAATRTGRIQPTSEDNGLCNLCLPASVAASCPTSARCCRHPSPHRQPARAPTIQCP